MSKITQNTTDLQAILDTVNALPEAGGGGELQELEVTPSHEAQEYIPVEGVAGYKKVTVNPVPRVPACVVSVESQSANVVETVVNIGAVVSVKSSHQETVTTNILYSVHVGGWFISNATAESTTSPVVTYFFPVEAGLTYSIIMEEIGNRLAGAFTTVDPSTIAGGDRVLSDYQDHYYSMAVGYEFAYTATEDGWYLVYVSNQDERPQVNVTTTTTEWVEDT